MPTIFHRTDGDFTVLIAARPERGSFRVRAWSAGDREASESHRDERDARLAAERIWGAYQSGLFEKVTHKGPRTLQSLTEQFVKRPDLAPATRRTYERSLGLFTKFAGAELAPESVTKDHISGWLKAATCGNVSKKSYLRQVRALFRYAVTEKWLSDDPSAELSVSAQVVMRSWLQSYEWPAFLEACPPSHRIRASFVLETGLRTSELVHARAAWIHQVRGRPAIRIASDPATGFVPKWGQARAVPLSAKAQEVLAEAKTHWGGSRFLFAGERLASPNFARENRIACKRAGVTMVDFHGLRRSAGARWLEVGLAIQEVSKLLGHQDVQTTMRHYAGIADGYLAGLMDRVDAAR